MLLAWPVIDSVLASAPRFAIGASDSGSLKNLTRIIGRRGSTSVGFGLKSRLHRRLASLAAHCRSEASHLLVAKQNQRWHEFCCEQAGLQSYPNSWRRQE